MKASIFILNFVTHLLYIWLNKVVVVVVVHLSGMFKLLKHNAADILAHADAKKSRLLH